MREIKIGDFKTTEEQKQLLTKILNSNKITEGVYTKNFENGVKNFLGVKHAIAVTNGTVALQLVAHYIKYKLKKEKPVVCVPATTFPATINAFLLSGYETMLCDIDKENLCINIDNLTEEEKKKIDVIVPVSLLGYAPEMDKILSESKKYDWLVVEDFAEAFGTKYKGERLGSLGDFGCSSFFISHVFQGGELGVVTTNDDEAAEIMKKMKKHGRGGDPMIFQHEFVGSNYKTTEFCTALVCEQLKEGESIIKVRQRIAKTYHDNIFTDRIKVMPVSEDYSFLGYPLIVVDGDKNKLCKQLNGHGVETRGMFPCLANQKAYEGMFDAKKYPVSVEMEEKGFYLGVHQYITVSEAEKIAHIINRWVQ